MPPSQQRQQAESSSEGQNLGWTATQVLKIIRYTSKLVLAGALSDPSSELAVRLKALESSIGTSRYFSEPRRDHRLLLSTCEDQHK